MPKFAPLSLPGFILMLLLCATTVAQESGPRALLVSGHVELDALPTQTGRTGTLVLLPDGGVTSARTGAAASAAATADVSALLQQLEADGFSVLTGNYLTLQSTLQERDFLFWHIPAWTVVINLMSATVLLLVFLKQPGLPLFRWLLGFALMGNLYYLPAAFLMPDIIQMCINLMYAAAICLFLRVLVRPLPLAFQESPQEAGLAAQDLPQIVLLSAVASVLLLIAVDSTLLLADMHLTRHPDMPLQTVPVAQVSAVLATLYFLISRHADMQAELELLNVSLDQRVDQATGELKQRYWQLTRDVLEADAARERRSIYQSIHEDLSDKLLQLVYCASNAESAALARSALAELRASHKLLPEQSRMLDEILADVRSEAQSRCDQAGVRLVWQQDLQLQTVRLSARQASAVSRTVREAFSNLLKHASATTAVFNVHLADGQQLVYSVSDNGLGLDADFTPGRGLMSMQSRVTEVGGTLKRSSNSTGGIRLEFGFSLDPSETDGGPLTAVAHGGAI